MRLTETQSLRAMPWAGFVALVLWRYGSDAGWALGTSGRGRTGMPSHSRRSQTDMGRLEFR
jgi:hypothetical protein